MSPSSSLTCTGIDEVWKRQSRQYSTLTTASSTCAFEVCAVSGAKLVCNCAPCSADSAGQRFMNSGAASAGLGTPAPNCVMMCLAMLHFLNDDHEFSLTQTAERGSIASSNEYPHVGGTFPKSQARTAHDRVSARLRWARRQRGPNGGSSITAGTTLYSTPPCLTSCWGIPFPVGLGPDEDKFRGPALPLAAPTGLLQARPPLDRIIITSTGTCTI